MNFLKRQSFGWLNIFSEGISQMYLHLCFENEQKRLILQPSVQNMANVQYTVTATNKLRDPSPIQTESFGETRRIHTQTVAGLETKVHKDSLKSQATGHAKNFMESNEKPRWFFWAKQCRLSGNTLHIKLGGSITTLQNNYIAHTHKSRVS